MPGTDLIFGTDFMGGLIQRFRFNVDGKLRQLPPVALPASQFSDTTTARLPLGVWHHPYLPLLYVGFVTDSKLGVYQYSLDGQLKFLRAVPNSGKAICWIRTNREGTRLCTTDTATNSVTVYNMVNPETPVEIQNFVLSGLGNVLQFDLSTDGKSLYALFTGQRRHPPRDREMSCIVSQSLRMARCPRSSLRPSSPNPIAPAHRV